MAEVIYHNTTGSSNKFWSYEINGNQITFKWGRVGTTGQTKVEPYQSHKLSKKIREKQKKGYDQINEEKLEKETTLAEGLGFRTKIQKLDFVRIHTLKNKKIKITNLDEYDSNEYIFVHLQDSWSKDNRWLLLSTQHGHKELKPSSATQSSWVVWSGAHGRTPNAIMDYLQDMIEKFTTIVTASFGGLGSRALDDDSYKKVVNKFKEESGIDQSEQVIGQIAKMGFASMGARRLDL